MKQIFIHPQSVAVTGNAVEAEILRLALVEPELGQAAVASRLQRAGLQISASGVRYIWQKHGLETAVKRLQALVVENDGDVRNLTLSQRRYLERGLLSTRLARGEGAEEGGDDLETGEADTLDRRSLILHAAAELFSEQGYDRTSIRDIAGKVGLLPGSVYHYFTSKDELYLAVHQEGFRTVMQRLKAAAAEGTDPWDGLRRAFTVHVECMVGSNLSAVQRLTGHSLAMTGHPSLLAKIRADRDAYEDEVKQLINALPLAVGVDRTLLRLLLLGAMNWVYVWYHEGKRTPEQIVAAMLAMVRQGVVADNMPSPVVPMLN